MLNVIYAVTSGALCTAFLGASLTGWQLFAPNTHYWRMPFMGIARNGIHHK